MTEQKAHEASKMDVLVEVLRQHTPMNKITVEPFIRLIARHAHAEIAGDFKEIMATVCEHPKYSFEPMGWIITDPALLFDFYVEALPILKNIRPIGVWNPMLYIGDSSVAVWDASLEYHCGGGRVTRVYQMATITFDLETRLLIGENVFMNAEMANIFVEGLSEGLKSRLKAK